MAFFKFRARGPQANEGRNSSVAAVPAESVEAMRRRARHRLMGAAVLVLVGVIGFPLLFDTQPRPVPVDIPIEIPDRTKAKPLPLPSTPTPSTPNAGAGTPTPPAAPEASATTSSRPNAEMITESADGSEIVPSKQAVATPAATPTPEAKPESKPEPKPEPKPAAEAKAKPAPETHTPPKPKPEPKVEAKVEAKVESKAEPKAEPKPPKSASVEDAARARALLEGKPSSAAAASPASASEDAGRFVVQVGAFADADKAREVRQKLEKAGIKTFTTVTKTRDGERTRVRVGPFTSRAEADRAAGKVKSLSMSAAVLSL